MAFLTFLLMAVAIEHLTDLLVNVDLLEEVRGRFELAFPLLGKLARCRFCQSFWMSGLAACAFQIVDLGKDLPSQFVAIGLTWLVLHKTVLILAESSERFLSRAPHGVSVFHTFAENQSDLSDQDFES